MGELTASLALGARALADPRILRVLAKSVFVSLALLAMLGIGAWYALDWSFAAYGLTDEAFAGSSGLRAALSFVLAALLLLIAWRVIAMAVINVFADDIVAAVEARFYPGAAASVRHIPMAEQVRLAAKGGLKALLANLVALPLALILLISGIGPFLVFFIVNTVLLGRELQDMVWLRHVAPAERRSAAAPLNRAQRLALGGVTAALLSVPFVNLIAPVFGASAATHLVHRRLAHPSTG